MFFYFFRDVRSRLIDFEVRREVASSQVTRIVTRSAFLELVTADTVAAEVVSRPAARTPPSTRAGGQDDGSLNKLPQIILSRVGIDGRTFRIRAFLQVRIMSETKKQG